MIVARGLGRPRLGSLVAAGLTRYPTPTPPVPAVQGDLHGGGLSLEMVEGYYELVDLRRRPGTSEKVSRGTSAPERFPAGRPIMVRLPGQAEPTEIAVPEGAQLSKERMLALMLALSELDD